MEYAFVPNPMVVQGNADLIGIVIKSLAKSVS